LFFSFTKPNQDITLKFILFQINIITAKEAKESKYQEYKNFFPNKIKAIIGHKVKNINHIQIPRVIKYLYEKAIKRSNFHFCDLALSSDTKGNKKLVKGEIKKEYILKREKKVV